MKNNKAALIIIADIGSAIDQEKIKISKIITSLYEAALKIEYPKVSSYYVGYGTNYGYYSDIHDLYNNHHTESTYVSVGLIGANKIIDKIESYHRDIYFIHITNNNNSKEDNKIAARHLKLLNKRTIYGANFNIQKDISNISLTYSQEVECKHFHTHHIYTYKDAYNCFHALVEELKTSNKKDIEEVIASDKEFKSKEVLFGIDNITRLKDRVVVEVRGTKGEYFYKEDDSLDAYNQALFAYADAINKYCQSELFELS